MPIHSRIEWTEVTWNLVTGCSKISPGCRHCYAEKFAKRLQAMGQARYRNGFEVALHENVLEAPLHWKRPRMVFVNSMSDLFHQRVPSDLVRRMFQVMSECPQHTFQFLTKRSRRLRLKGVTEREEIALRIADAVERELSLAKSEICTSLALRHEVRHLGLTRRRITVEELEEAERGATEDRAEYERLCREAPDDYAGISGAFGRARWFAGVAERFRLQTDQPTYPVELHVVRLGDVAFATNPFELFLDFGLRLKARSKAVQTFCVQLAGSGTYVPTERAVAGKSYGAGAPSNAVGPEGGQELVEETVALLDRLWAEG